MSIPISQQANIQSFGTWFTRQNQMAALFTSNTVTSDTTAGGSLTTGNSQVNGYLAVLNLNVGNNIGGGNNTSTANLNISTNTVFANGTNKYLTLLSSPTATAILISSNTLNIANGTYINNINAGAAQIANLSVGTYNVTNAAITNAAITTASITNLTVGGVPYIAASANAPLTSLEFVISGGGQAISTGLAGWLQAEYAGTINSVTLICDQTGSIVVDVWKCTYAQWSPGTHPVVGDSICSTYLPTVTSGVKYTDSTLTGWTTTINAGDIITFNVKSCTTTTLCTIAFKITKS